MLDDRSPYYPAASCCRVMSRIRDFWLLLCSSRPPAVLLDGKHVYDATIKIDQHDDDMQSSADVIVISIILFLLPYYGWMMQDAIQNRWAVMMFSAKRQRHQCC